MRQTYRITCLSRALSPITHNAKTAGNEALLARLPVLTPTGVRDVPWLSGNVNGRTLADLFASPLQPGHKLGEGSPLFPRVDQKR